MFAIISGSDLSFGFQKVSFGFQEVSFGFQKVSFGFREVSSASKTFDLASRRSHRLPGRLILLPEGFTGFRDV
jgi:hypothetical protein